MDHLITEQIEWLYSCNLQGNRLARHILVLSGYLANGEMPERINQQLGALSRQLLAQETFDALVNSLNLLAKAPLQAASAKDSATPAAFPDLAPLVAQIDDARQKLLQVDPVNYAELIGWIGVQARTRKLFPTSRRR